MRAVAQVNPHPANSFADKKILPSASEAVTLCETGIVLKVIDVNGVIHLVDCISRKTAVEIRTAFFKEGGSG